MQTKFNATVSNHNLSQFAAKRHQTTVGVPPQPMFSDLHRPISTARGERSSF